MNHRFVGFGLLLIFSGALLPAGPQGDDRVIFDFTMVEKGLPWLDLIKSGAPDQAVRAYYDREIVPTRGCQAIIHHWARFRKWDADELFTFIMAALDRAPAPGPETGDDGAPTAFGMRKRYWRSALENTGRMRENLARLKAMDMGQSLVLAKRGLPEGTPLEADFYFVLFGHSTAFSVGRENGFDFLQLQKDADGRILDSPLLLTLAHELHHTGFTYWDVRKPDAADEEKFTLMGILAGEGMATYFVDKSLLDKLSPKTAEGPFTRQLAKEWTEHQAGLAGLYARADEDIRLNREGTIGQKEIMERWMAGLKGPAYALGADMIGVIDRRLGHARAVDIAKDYRVLIRVYNQAAALANASTDRTGPPLYIFRNGGR